MSEDAMVLIDDPLKTVKEILIDLNNTLHQMEKFWGDLKDCNPHLESLQKEWKIKQRRCWLHGATDYKEAAVLEEWIYDYPPLAETAKQNATECVKCWKEDLEIKDAYYGDFEEFEVVVP